MSDYTEMLDNQILETQENVNELKIQLESQMRTLRALERARDKELNREQLKTQMNAAYGYGRNGLNLGCPSMYNLWNKGISCSLLAGHKGPHVNRQHAWINKD